MITMTRHLNMQENGKRIANVGMGTGAPKYVNIGCMPIEPFDF